MNSSIKDVQISKSETKKRSGTLYRVSGSLFICKTTSSTVPHAFVACARDRIHEFTAGASQRMRRYLRECTSEYRHMVTLTYPGFFDSDGEKSKEHLRRFLQELKRKVERDDAATISYSSFWFLEFQERGAPHYHLFTTHYFKKEFISRRWYEIVNSEDPRHLTAGTRCEKLERGRSGLISYATKYANKNIQKIVPDNYENVGRFWGVSGCRSTMSADTFVSRDDRKQEGVRNTEKSIGIVLKEGILAGTVTVYRREKGVGIYILNTKEVWRRLMLKVSILSAKTAKVPQLFQDAEI